MNRGKKWKYGYNKEHDLIVLSNNGVIGEITIDNAGRVSKRRLQAYRCLFYSKLISEDPDQERFFYGWFKRAISI